MVKELIDIDIPNDSAVTAFRLGRGTRADGKPRHILVKNYHRAQDVLRNAKRLRASPDFINIYVDRDLSAEKTKELATLRKRAFEWKRDNPGDTAYVKGNRLFINGVPADDN